MYPLIEIKSVPIEIAMKTTPARMEYTRGTAEMEIARDKGGLNIRSSPIRIKLDTFEARSSIVPTAAQSVAKAAKAGKEAAYAATASYARQGQLLLKAKIGEELVTQFALEAQNAKIKTNVGLQFLPTSGPEISWDVGEMSIRYEMDKLNFDWKVGNGDFKFVPGDIEFSITQKPDVIIKYIGGPIYVPPSAEPGYVPVNAEA